MHMAFLNNELKWKMVLNKERSRYTERVKQNSKTVTFQYNRGQTLRVTSGLSETSSKQYRRVSEGVATAVGEYE